MWSCLGHGVSTTKEQRLFGSFSVYLSVVSYSHELGVVLGDYRTMRKCFSEVCQHWFLSSY